MLRWYGDLTCDATESEGLDGYLFVLVEVLCEMSEEIDYTMDPVDRLSRVSYNSTIHLVVSFVVSSTYSMMN